MSYYRKHNIDINKLRNKFNSNISDADIRSAVKKSNESSSKFMRDIAKTL